MLSMDFNIIIAVASALLGGTGAKAVDVLIKRYANKVTTSSKVRSELWEDNEHLRHVNDRVQSELDELQERYFAVIKDRNTLKVQNMRLEIQAERCKCGNTGR